MNSAQWLSFSSASFSGSLMCLITHSACFGVFPCSRAMIPWIEVGETLRTGLSTAPALQLHTSLSCPPTLPENEGLDDTENPFKLSLIDQVEEKDKICLPQKAKHISYPEFKVATCWGGIEGFPKSTASSEQPVTPDTLLYCVGSPRLTLFDP